MLGVREATLSLRQPGLMSLKLMPASNLTSLYVESSLRTRSIVFIGLGIYAASQIGADIPLLAPENGTIALKLALTFVALTSMRIHHLRGLRPSRDCDDGIPLTQMVEQSDDRAESLPDA